MRPDPPVPDARTAERELILGYARPGDRAALTALLAFDGLLGGLVRDTRAPLAGQLRLAWWRDALLALADAPTPAHPVLQALAADVAPRLATATLVSLVDGWEALLGDPVDFAAHADGRGGGLFHAAATLIGAPHDQLAMAGRGWAFADVATHWSDRGRAVEARAAAETALANAFGTPWPRALRALGALALLARADLGGVPAGSPSRVARLAWHRLTGR